MDKPADLIIAVNGNKVLGPSWEALERLVDSMQSEQGGRFVRISRRGAGCNYRDERGQYEVVYVDVNGNSLDVLVKVS